LTRGGEREAKEPPETEAEAEERICEAFSVRHRARGGIGREEEGKPENIFFIRSHTEKKPSDRRESREEEPLARNGEKSFREKAELELVFHTAQLRVFSNEISTIALFTY
jgi:hypothetical protein